MKNWHIFGSCLKKQVLTWQGLINCAEFCLEATKSLTGTWKQLLIVLLVIYFMGYQFARVVSDLHDLMFL
jgi:hypothetical protein